MNKYDKGMMSSEFNGDDQGLDFLGFSNEFTGV